MKSKRLYILLLFLIGIFVYSLLPAKAVKPLTSVHISITVNSPNSHSGQRPTGDSPFIRFHSGISGSNVSITSQYVSVIALKSVNIIPEKFAGIGKYISSLYIKVPPGEVFLYSLPLRSPPLV